jgi:NAD(P)-dependent dehydrogenase (short-subunit alcohol dehydrogenase family)
MKTVFITGAAHGIGLASARRLAADGWFVGLYDINAAAVADLLDTPEFGAACGSHCDVRDPASVEQALQHFAEHTQGRLDLLLNNAGVLTAGPFEEIEPAAHDAMVEVNIQGATRVAQLAFPWLKKTPGAALLNLCSVSSLHGVPLLAVYSASKFYVDGLTQALSIEWAKHDIRVFSIKPPFVGTTMVEGMPPQLMKSFTVDLAPEDVADIIVRTLDGSSQSYLLGWKAKAFGLLARLLPEALARRLTMYLTGF